MKAMYERALIGSIECHELLGEYNLAQKLRVYVKRQLVKRITYILDGFIKPTKGLLMNLVI